jgi:hypothetical protein
MPKLDLRLSDDLYDKLVRHAEETGVTMSDTARDAIERYLSSDLAIGTTVPVPVELAQPATPVQPVHPHTGIHHTSIDHGQLRMARCGRHIDAGDGYCPTCQR